MPERFPARVVEELRRRRLIFAGQYQQRPAPAEGNFIKRKEVRYYGGIDPTTAQPDEQLPTQFDRKVISVDCAFKDVATADYVAILVVGVKGRKRYVLNVINQHLGAAATEAEIRRQRQLYEAYSILIEDKANGPAVIQRLKATVPGVIEVNPQGGKTARMFAAAPEFQAGCSPQRQNFKLAIGMSTVMLRGLKRSSRRSRCSHPLLMTIWSTR